MKRLTAVVVFGLLGCGGLPATASAVPIVSDTFTDGGADNGADALDAHWRAINASSISVATNETVLGSGNVLNVDATGTFSRMTGTFADPITLQPGETLTFAFDYRFTQAGANSGGAFRFGIYNNGGTTTTSTTNETDDFGYGVTTNPGSNSATGTSLATESAGNSVLSGATPHNMASFGTAGESLTHPTDVARRAVMTLTRSADGTSLGLSASIDGETPATGTLASPSTFTFHQVAIGQGNITNDYRIDNVVVQVVPEPAGLLALAVAAPLLARRRRSAKSQ